MKEKTDIQCLPLFLILLFFYLISKVINSRNKTIITKQTAVQWLLDASKYEKVPFDINTVKMSCLSDDHIGQLLEVEHIVPIQQKDVNRIRGCVHVFKVPEDHKQRFRCIQHPEAANEAYRGLTGRRNSTRRSARAAVVNNEGFIAFDMASYYPQFPVTERAPSRSELNKDGLE